MGHICPTVRSGVKYKHTPPYVLPFLSHRTMLKPSIRISESRMLLFRKVSVRPTNSVLLSVKLPRNLTFDLSLKESRSMVWYGNFLFDIMK